MNSPNESLAAALPQPAPTGLIDGVRSRQLSHLVNARNRDCYRNAYRALCHVSGGQYVEGLVVLEDAGFALIEHGWIEHAGKAILDPTPNFCEEERRATYFPVFRWTLQELRALLKHRMKSGGGATFPIRDMLEERRKTNAVWMEATRVALQHRAAAMRGCVAAV